MEALYKAIADVIRNRDGEDQAWRSSPRQAAEAIVEDVIEDLRDRGYLKIDPLAAHDSADQG